MGVNAVLDGLVGELEAEVRQDGCEHRAAATGGAGRPDTAEEKAARLKTETAQEQEQEQGPGGSRAAAAGADAPGPDTARASGATGRAAPVDAGGLTSGRAIALGLRGRTPMIRGFRGSGAPRKDVTDAPDSGDETEDIDEMEAEGVASEAAPPLHAVQQAGNAGVQAQTRAVAGSGVDQDQHQVQHRGSDNLSGPSGAFKRPQRFPL
jgi:hypothetical protein